MTLSISIPSVPYADITNFGADPTGTSDSTAAFLAAEASLPASGGVVFMPPGTYKTTTGITFTKPGTSLWGSGSGGGSGQPGISIVDATSLGANHYTSLIPVIGNSAPNPRGCSFRNFKINMAIGVPANVSDQVGITGIRLSDNCTQIVLDNIVIIGGDHSYLQFGNQHCSIFGCLFQNPTGQCWWLLGCAFCDSYGSLFSNAGYGNVKMSMYGSVSNYHCHVYGGNVDESGSWSVWIEDADHCSINGSNIWTGTNGAVNLGGPGTTSFYGVRNFRLAGCRMQPFQTNINSQTATIYVGSVAVGTRLVDCDTNPQGGNDIIDYGAGTQYTNVNGQSSIPIVPPTCTATLSGTIASGDTLPFVFSNANVTGFPHTVTYTVGASDTSLSALAAHVAVAINADRTCINAGVSATAGGTAVIIQQPGLNALNTTVACTPAHGGGGSEAVTTSNSGAFLSGVPTASTFLTAPAPTYSSWGAAVPPVPTGTGALPSGIPLGPLLDVNDNCLYYLDPSGNVRYVSWT